MSKNKRHGYFIHCQVCGFKTHSDDMRERWDGLLVCSEDWEERHPLDTPRRPRKERSPRRVSPEPSDVNISDVFPNGVTKDDL